MKMSDIPYAFATNQKVKIEHCEFVSNAYEEIMKAEQEGKIVIERYENVSDNKHKWIEKMIIQEYRENEYAKDYQHFLRGKFSFLSTGF